MNIKELWPKPTVIKLDEYEKVNVIGDLYGYQSVVIEPIPITQDDGSKIQPPPLYFRKGELKEKPIADVSSIEWSREVQISKNGSHEEYCKRVDWWVKEALTNEAYRRLLNSEFNNNGFEIKLQWTKAVSWLKGPLSESERKTKLHQFIWNWLKRSHTQHTRIRSKK